MTWGKCSVCIKIDKNDRNEKKNDWGRPKNSFGIYNIDLCSHSTNQAKMLITTYIIQTFSQSFLLLIMTNDESTKKKRRVSKIDAYCVILMYVHLS